MQQAQRVSIGIFILIVLLSLFLSPPAAYTATLHVGNGEKYQTIQAGRCSGSR
ncbi:hypothetical protein [Desulforhabdus amnigena]|uniref:Uncharacterized protein n=1 Tax=Desulforhabdus amnigena TaxID=40218 RepID=A0A9W6FVL6_9BACT|nr:hypothetical protein [Desulforhabdus amnigena]NLJ28922.1 hypothetical protein [Deltaproteobacteria bacterium]GLI35658.1 hypothetical protein DAMNIGENAA_30910 [Desulforhabdus amnigena]